MEGVRWYDIDPNGWNFHFVLCLVNLALSIHVPYRHYHTEPKWAMVNTHYRFLKTWIFLKPDYQITDPLRIVWENHAENPLQMFTDTNRYSTTNVTGRFTSVRCTRSTSSSLAFLVTMDLGSTRGKICSFLQNNHLPFKTGCEKRCETASKIIGLNPVSCPLILITRLLEAWHPFYEASCKENIWINDII